jgi:peptidoglycan/LPS O-acetylase OafA/YrhL
MAEPIEPALLVDANRPAGGGTVRAPGLDVLRTLAAFGVLVTHVAFVTGVVNPQRWSSPLRDVLPRLDVGVSIFFVLSGLLICRPFIAAVVEGRPQPAAGPYLWRRALRIFPLYWVILVVTLAADGRPLPPPGELVSDVLLVHVYRPATAIGPITQSWSLATEVAFYLFVPLFFGALARWLDRRGVVAAARRRRWLAGGLVGWAVVALAFRLVVLAATHTYDIAAGGVDTRGAALTWMPNHLDEFAVGAALALWLQSGRAPRVTSASRAASYAVAAAALWTASTALDLPPVFTGFGVGQTLARHALFVVCAAALVGPSALAVRRTPSRAAPWMRVASAGAMASYGVYLWHQLVATRWMSGRGYPDFQAPFGLSLLAIAVGATVLATATYLVVERPIRPLASLSWRLERGVEPRRLGVAPALDGLRGLSILAVLGTHIVFLASGDATWSLRGGFLGVDVFLVLSGFLIGATLLREADATGGVRMGRFLRRRARRLVPPLAGFFAVHLVVVLLIGDRLREELVQAVLALTFVGNWQLAAGHHPPFDLVHLGSLALEGQLYVLCGLVVWRARRSLDRTPVLVGALVALVGAVGVWRIVEVGRGVDLISLYERTDALADAMLVGLAAALVWRSRLLSSAAARRAGALGGAFIVVAWVFAHNDDRWLFVGGFTAISVAAAACVLAALEDGSVLARIGSVPVLRWLGRISYSLYLWHLPIYVWTVRALPADTPLATKVVIAVPTSIVAGWAGYRAFERRVVGAPRGQGQIQTAAAPSTSTA